MNLNVSDQLEIALPPGAASVRLTPSEALDLAETLVRCSIRRAMEEEAAEVLEAEEDSGAH